MEKYPSREEDLEIEDFTHNEPNYDINNPNNDLEEIKLEEETEKQKNEVVGILKDQQKVKKKKHKNKPKKVRILPQKAKNGDEEAELIIPGESSGVIKNIKKSDSTENFINGVETDSFSDRDSHKIVIK